MKVLVTGGSGFLGASLLRRLKDPTPLAQSGGVRVVVFDLRPPSAHTVEYFQGDIADPDALAKAMVGVDVVFHMAALIDWGRESAQRLAEVNVEGTRNVVAAASEAGVKALVHTSSIDVVYTGQPILDGDESLPYAETPANGYCETKTEGEKVALASDDPNGMRVCVIRPASVFGPGDPYHVQALVDLAAKRQLFRVGDGRSRSQMVYVDNVAHAHVLAAAALLHKPSIVGGKAYFITDGPPANFFDFFAPVVQAAGFTMPERGLPTGPLYVLGALFEGIAWLVRPVWRFAPKLTRFSVRFVALDFTVVGDKAKRELGYSPTVDDREAMRRTCAFYEPSRE